MAEESNLVEAQDLKRLIAEGGFRSLIHVVLDGVGRLLQKLARRSEPPAPWISALVIALLIMVVGLIISLLAGGLSQYGVRTLMFGGGLIFLTIIIPRSTVNRTFATLHDQLLDALESSAGITSLHGWLTAVASKRGPILTSLLYVVINIVYGMLLLGDIETPVDVMVVGFPMFVISGMMIYYLLLFLVLPGRLARCHYVLNTWDPVSTEVISQLSGLFNYIAYMIAFLLAAMSLFTVSLVTFDITNLILVIPTWLVLIAIFVAGQMSLSRIVKRAKRESLSQVEAQMAALRQRGDPPEKETLETLMRTWDYHDRINGTRNSVLGLKGIFNFINTLLIPLIAFVFANRNEILGLLGWER